VSKAIEKSKHETNLRAKASLHAALRAKSWEEKVAAIERMNAAAKLAREAMQRAKAAESKR